MSLFADTLTRNEVIGMPFPSSWFQSANPIFVIMLTPLAAALWMKLGKHQPSSPVKFGLGLTSRGVVSADGARRQLRGRRPGVAVLAARPLFPVHGG